jgi:hypothetical protein
MLSLTSPRHIGDGADDFVVLRWAFPPLPRGPSVLSLIFEAVPFHGATGVVVIDIGTLRTEVEISAPVARTVDIGFFHGGADP